jgi:hypothetical protein
MAAPFLWTENNYRTTLSGVDEKPPKEAPIRNDLWGLFVLLRVDRTRPAVRVQSSAAFEPGCVELVGPASMPGDLFASLPAVKRFLKVIAVLVFIFLVHLPCLCRCGACTHSAGMFLR